MMTGWGVISGHCDEEGRVTGRWRGWEEWSGESSGYQGGECWVECWGGCRPRCRRSREPNARWGRHKKAFAFASSTHKRSSPLFCLLLAAYFLPTAATQLSLTSAASLARGAAAVAFRGASGFAIDFTRM